VNLDLMLADDREDLRSNRSLQVASWGFHKRGILVINHPLVASVSLEESGDSRSGEVLILGVGKNHEGVSIGGHVVILVDECGLFSRKSGVNKIYPT